jgi:hypothetical protein
MRIEVLGIDIAKNAFQLHGVNRGGGAVFKRRVMRDQLLKVVAQIERCTIVIEACTGASTGLVNLRTSAPSRTELDQDRHRNRCYLSAHLPQVDRIIEPASTYPCGCADAMTKIGEDVSERLDVIPAQWRVLVTRRPKYVCRSCSGAVVQALAPERVVPGGLPTEAEIAQVIVSICGTARATRAFSVDFTHWNGAVVCPAFTRGTWPRASMRSTEQGAKSSSCA